MKKVKFDKFIKILTYIASIMLVFISAYFIVCSFINWDVHYFETRHYIYVATKYTTFSFVFISIITSILLLINSFKRNDNKFYALFRVITILCILLSCIIMLFVYSKKYGTKTDIWYAHSSLFTGLLLTASCVMISFAIQYSMKYKPEETNNDYLKEKIFFKKTMFIYEVLWISILSIVGFVTMFYIKKVAQTTTMCLLCLMVYMCFNSSFVFYLNNKQNSIKTKNPYTILSLFSLICTSTIILYLLVSYLCMYPIRIIDAYRINYVIAGFDYALPIILIAPYILISKNIIYLD